MSENKTTDKARIHNTISWIFVLIFFVLGILNLIFVHPIPFLFYVGVGLIYLPLTNKFLNLKVGLAIPLALKIMVGLLILWSTFAVGDLMEMFEAWIGV